MITYHSTFYPSTVILLLALECQQVNFRLFEVLHCPLEDSSWGMQFSFVALPGGLLHPLDLFFVGVGVCGLEVLHLMVSDWEFAGGLD